MKCPNCNSKDVITNTTRKSKKDYLVIRYKECKSCSYKFKTWESLNNLNWKMKYKKLLNNIKDLYEREDDMS